MKHSIIIALLCLMLVIFPVQIWASEIRVSSYEELKNVVFSEEESIIIVITQDITIPHALTIRSGANVTIKSCDDDFRHISSNNSDYIFITDETNSITFENIKISSSYIKGMFYGSGTLTFNNSYLISSPAIGDNNNITNIIPENADPSPLELANLIISWSGLIIAFLTIGGAFISFWGFHEITKIKQIHSDLETTKLSFEKSLANIETIEANTKKELDNLALQFKKDANTIMNATYHYSQGTLEYKKGNYVNAIQSLKQSLHYISNNTEAICLIGRAYTFLGKREQALNYYNDALSIDANSIAAFRGLAAWYRFTDLPKALSYAEKAANLAPNNIEVLNYYAQLLRDNKEYQKSLNVLLNSYNIQRHPDTCFFLSTLYISENSLGRARLHIQEAISGYENKTEYGIAKPVWLELAKWVYILIENEKPSRLERATIQLGNIKKEIESSKTKDVVMLHVEYVLNALKLDSEYIHSNLEILNA